MRRANRFLLTAGLLAIVASGADASLWHHKKGDTPAPAAAAESASAVSADPAAMSLTGIELDGVHVVLHTTGTPAYTSYSPSPDVFVVDLSSTGKGAELKVPTTYPNGIASIAAENAVEMGTRLTRITFRFTQPMTPTASVGENAVVVTLPIEAKAEQPAPAPFTPPAPAPEQVATKSVEPEAPHGIEPIVPEPVVKSQPLEPAPAQLAVVESRPAGKAKKLKDVAVDGSAIRISGDGELTYKAFQLAGPDRVVLDISGVRNAVAKKNIIVNDSVVKRVRIGQFSPDVIRVVLDLDSKATYDVARQGESLVVTFGGAPAPAAPQQVIAVNNPPAPPAPKPATVKITNADLRAQVPVIAENAPTWKMPESASKGAKSVISAPAGQTAPATTPPKRTTRTLSVPTTATGAAATANPNAAAGTAEDVFNEQNTTTTASGGREAVLTNGNITGAGGRTLSAAGRVYTGEPISLNLKDADIKDVLRTFAQLTGLNIAVDPGVGGSVTVDFVDVPWDQALDLILRQNGLTYVLEGNVMRVGTIDRLASETAATRRLAEEERLNVPLSTVSFLLSYAKAGEVSGLLRDIASPRARIIVDQRTNQLIISEIPQYLQLMRNLIDSIDVPTKQVVIEARIVETTKNFLQQYGFVWGFRGSMDPALGTGTGLIFPNRVGVVGGPFEFGPGNPVLALTLSDVLGTFNLDLALNAAEAEGLVKVVSAPKVTTQNNTAAEIQSGFQIPYQTRINFTTTVTYVDATLRLSVTPQITEAGTVIMDIQVQKNEPATGLAVEGGAGTPLSTRQARTKLMVRDGGTSVIAGIYQVKENTAQSRLPFLHQIPVIGNLFKEHNVSSTHDELLIFITPRIVRS
ncbi:MAG TPA: type IV pilus secretin PilQ [Thermoanaerobaculia bacterium]|nr:type IV pilus secretin PilQ [Thermoanaerobaculia bacterium]